MSALAEPCGSTFGVRPLDPFDDTALVHRWVTHPKAAFRPLSGTRLQDVEREYMAIAARPHHDAFIGLHDGEPAFLMERYDPAGTGLKGLYEAEPGDVGMHFLIAPTDTQPLGHTLAVLTAVMEALFADPAVRRVVVDHDVRNSTAHALHRSVGFEALRVIGEPGRSALLSACTRERFQAATAGVHH
ncbi:GNAT family N-acetyltransferase [Streptomyces sp. BE147]|uniref:GNAT family N-acetyltransferase n=1 Tax=unclassified Streptomyces TaxID=2593676 RepID=UPI002E777373|nr:GNAT family N-acetyltransferase [Streptomyces sp. BE147]MEE1739625.1 GNAT family N-acetyltransferase [Streptomyces sp. BE147]